LNQEGILTIKFRLEHRLLSFLRAYTSYKHKMVIVLRVYFVQMHCYDWTTQALPSVTKSMLGY